MRTKKIVDKRKKSALKRHVSSNPMPMRTKKIVDKRKKSALKRHVSSNSTWAKVSEKPKVVRYYTCPYYQSKIEKTDIAKNQDMTLKEPVESPMHMPVTEEKRKEAETVKVESAIFPELVEDIEAIEPPVLVAASEPVEPKEKIKSIQTKDNQCKYYFGYLQKREKSEGIPETCLDCPKFFDCMFSNPNEPKTAVSEIKTGYNIFK